MPRHGAPAVRAPFHAAHPATRPTAVRHPDPPVCVGTTNLCYNVVAQTTNMTQWPTDPSENTISVYALELGSNLVQKQVAGDAHTDKTGRTKRSPATHPRTWQ